VVAFFRYFSLYPWIQLFDNDRIINPIHQILSPKIPFSQGLPFSMESDLANFRDLRARDMFQHLRLDEKMALIFYRNANSGAASPKILLSLIQSHFRI